MNPPPHPLFVLMQSYTCLFIRTSYTVCEGGGKAGSSASAQTEDEAGSSASAQTNM